MKNHKITGGAGLQLNLSLRPVTQVAGQSCLSKPLPRVGSPGTGR